MPIATVGHISWRITRLVPWLAACEQLGELWLEHAELVAPGIAEGPEVLAAFLLVIASGGGEGFESAHLGLYVVGLQVEMHALLLELGVARLL